MRLEEAQAEYSGKIEGLENAAEVIWVVRGANTDTA